MAGTITELVVAAKLAQQAIAKKISGAVEAAPDLTRFSESMQSLIDKAPAGTIKSHAWLDMSGKQAPWLASDMNVAIGDHVSYFIDGRIYANEFLDIYLPLALQVWCKVSDGNIFRGTIASHSFIAEHAGAVQFGNYFPNDWLTPQGERQQDDTVYKSSTGTCRILVVQWSGVALEGVTQLLKVGDYVNYLQAELNRIEQGNTTPQGWSYLWNIGPADIYRDVQRGDLRVNDKSVSSTPCIHCHTSGDTGILQYDVDLPLDQHSELSWRWLIDVLPSPLREDAVPSHDYMSIAVEFDNGRDITYYWSSTLAVGTGYDCPLPNWQGKEYHVVIRSGDKGLGQWQAERRNLYQDYQHYMGEPPKRIVKVWLIANSIFQRNVGQCDYADIALHSGDKVTQVL